MNSNVKQKFSRNSITHFRQGNPLTEVCEFDNLDIVKQKKEELFRFCTYSDYADVDGTDSPFQKLLILDSKPLDNDLLFPMRNVAEENRFLVEENREAQQQQQQQQQPQLPVVWSEKPSPEKKKSKAVRKKDAEKNSQIIDPSREPNYIGNLPLEEILKNFETFYGNEKQKKSAKKKSNGRKSKGERTNIEDEEADVPIILDLEEGAENVSPVRCDLPLDSSRRKEEEEVLKPKKNLNYMFLPETNNNDIEEIDTADFENFQLYKNSKNGGRKTENKLYYDEKFSSKAAPKILSKKMLNIHDFQKVSDLYEPKTTLLLNGSVKKLEKFPVTDTVFSISNPFYGKSADRIKRMSDAERMGLWAMPLQLSHIQSFSGKSKTAVYLLQSVAPATISALGTLIEERRKSLKTVENALMLEDIAFLKVFGVGKKNCDRKLNTCIKKGSNDKYSVLEKSKLALQQTQLQPTAVPHRQQPKKSTRKSSSNTANYSIRGG